MKKKKKILALFPSIHMYGKERSNIEVFKLLSNNEDFELLILSNFYATTRLKEGLIEFECKDIKYPKRDHKYLRYARYFIETIRSTIHVILYYLKFKPHCIYINNEMSIYDNFFLLLFTKAKIIYRIGDIPAFPSLSMYKINSYMWNKIVVNKVFTIISISNFIKKQVDKTGRNNKNDRVIYNLPPERKETSFPIKNRHHTFTVGYLGQIVELKGVHILLEAILNLLEENVEIEFIIAGNTELNKEYSSKLFNQTQNTSFSNKIKFIGEIDNIQFFFNNIDVVCMPTIWPEALGNVLVESKLNRTPAIIFPSGGMPEVISHLKDGYICSNKNVEALKTAIMYFINNKELLSKMGENAFQSLKELGINKELFSLKWNNVFTETLQ